LLAAAPAAALPAGSDPFSEAQIRHNQERYVGFGVKASGGPGDKACGAWLEAGLVSLGYSVRRQPFQAPFFEAAKAELVSGTAGAVVIPQGVVVPTGPKGLTAPLRLAGPGQDLHGTIAVVTLPNRRWSTAVDPQVQRALKEAFDAGALAVALVTTGPSHEALALNCPPEAPMFPRPVVTLGPKDVGPLMDQIRSGAQARLTVAGRGGYRPAFNLIARKPGAGGKAIVMSTPRSGWFSCGAERGSGVAAWLALAVWLARRPGTPDVELLCTSGHEYENMGGAQYIEHAAPKPAQVGLWVHIGANVAARDWRDEGGRLVSTDKVDGSRVLMVSPALVPAARAAFAGQPGLENPRPGTVQTAAGELINILKDGYQPVVGVFGVHIFHHAKADDLRCTLPSATRQAALGFKAVIEKALG
jgi:hypothetical protein